MDIQLHPAFCMHEIGQRSNNEDNIYPPKVVNAVKSHEKMFLVCDGVGGLEKGEVASRIVCDIVSSYLSERMINEAEINNAIALAEKEIDNYILTHKDATGMATTLTFLATTENGILVAHIGDSRVYQVRGGSIIFKTEDHSFVNELVTQNIISAEEARSHPKRNVITKAIVGFKQHQDADVVNITDLREDDYFFMCTDGVLESIDDADLMRILGTEEMSNIEKLQWIKLECISKSKDNFSAYLIQIKAV